MSIRIVEFKNILNTFPQVQYAIEDHMRVDYLALAQHYGLNTNLIDVTSEPEIAAYFATHRWIDGIAVKRFPGLMNIMMKSQGCLEDAYEYINAGRRTAVL